jgi:hypothetical protein
LPLAGYEWGIVGQWLFALAYSRAWYAQHWRAPQSFYGP